VQRRRPIIAGLLLIGLGGFFLYANLRPGIDPWPLLSRYWPFLLIFLGLGRLWDYFRLRNHPEAASGAWPSGGEVAVLLLLLLFGIGLLRGRTSIREVHQVESVDRRGADSARVRIRMPAGELAVAGGANKLLEAVFDYSEAEGIPQIAYEVIGKQGQLDLSQPTSGPHFGRTRNRWDLRLANDVPMELRIEMGAGRSDLRLQGLSLNKLALQMGAGDLTVDLTGDWKKDLVVTIQGGVGRATIRLPKNVGVRAHAVGGIGSIRARGLKREGDAYVNDAYGSSGVAVRLDIQGGIGEINLETES